MTPEEQMARQQEVQALIDSGSITDPQLMRDLVVEFAQNGMDLQVTVDPRIQAQQVKQANAVQAQAPGFLSYKPEMPAPGPVMDDPTGQVEAMFQMEPFDAGAVAPPQAQTDLSELKDSDIGRLVNKDITNTFVRDVDPEYGQSASNRKDTFVPPFYEAPENPATYAPMSENRPFMYYDPPVSRMMKLPGITPGQMQDLESAGEDSETYGRLADALWGEAVKVHAKHKLPIARVERLSPEGMGQQYTKLLGMFGAPAMSLFSSVDDMAALGAARQAMLQLDQGGDTPAIAELRNAGIMPSANEQVNDAQEKHRVAGAAGTALGIASPGAGGKMFGWAGKGARDAAGALKPLVGRIPNVLKTGLAGGGLSLGQELVGGTGALARGEEGVPAGKIGQRVLDDAVVSTMFGGLAEVLGSAGRYTMDRIRTSGKLGDEIRAIELAPSMDGARGTGVLAGKRSTPEMKRAANTLARRHRNALAGRATDTEVESVAGRMAGRHKVGMLTEIDRMRSTMDDQLSAENQAYYSSPEGQQMADTFPLAKTLHELRTRAKGELFGDTGVIDKALSRLIVTKSYKDAGARALPAEAGKVWEAVDYGMPPEVVALKSQMPGHRYLGHNTETGEAYFVKRMNARELDGSIGNLDRKLREYAASSSGAVDPKLKIAQAELRSLYDQFGANKATGQRSYAAFKDAHHKQQTRQEWGEAAFDVPSMSRRPESFNAIQAVNNRMMNLGSTDAERYRAMKDILRESPDLQRWLDEVRPAVMAHESQGGVRFTGGKTTGANMWSTVGPEKIKTHFVDPLASQFSMLAGRGNVAGAMGSENDAGPAAWQAIKSAGEMGYAGAGLMGRMYKWLDELKEEGRTR